MSELNSDTRRLVDLARAARTPAAEDKLRVARRLAAPLAASAAVGTAVGAAKAGGLASIGLKLAAVALVGAVGAVVTLRQLEPAPVVIPPPARQVAAASATADAKSEPVVSSPAVSAPVEPTPAANAPHASTKSAPSSKPSDDLAQEAALLHQAQAAWRAGQSAEALALANQHAERYPRSQLGNERDVLRVLTLCKLGQVQTARQVGARLLRKAKGSPWYQSVAESCAAK
jgi:predicted lipid-binding transport protein (Tim44 family)